jgi:GNAT superfamily N-acetyltransferase
MGTDRAFLIAPVEAILVAEPTVESQHITDDQIHDVAQLLLDAYVIEASNPRTLDMARSEVDAMLAGENGEPWREAWLGIWDAPTAPPVAAILCTRWRGMPYVAQIITAPSARNRGYASSLIREFAAVAQANGDTHVGVMLKHGNPALSLMTELGFVEMFTPAGL